MRMSFSLCMLLFAVTAPVRVLSADVAFTSEPDGAPMMLVPAGEFIYGIDRAEILALEKRLAAPWDNQINPSEFGRKKLTLPGFYIDKYDVTNSRYNAFVAATGHRSSRYSKYPQLNAPQQPVVGVGWDDAVAYCKWSNKRLATEQEWEKAARGVDGRLWPWGNELRDRAFNGRAAGVGAPSDVGSFPAGDSPFGVSDMAGNVWQITDGKWDAEGRTMRGGSFLNTAADVRTTVRWSPGEEDRGTIWLGFRCAKSLSPSEADAADKVPIVATVKVAPKAAKSVPDADQAVLRVLKISQETAEVDDLRIRPPMDSKQVGRARKSMGVPVDETVLALLNATLSGDGEEGLIFGTRGIYYRTSSLRTGGPAAAFIPYDEFSARQFRADGVFNVYLDKGQYFNVSKSNIKSKQLSQILNGIKQALAGG